MYDGACPREGGDAFKNFLGRSKLKQKLEFSNRSIERLCFWLSGIHSLFAPKTGANGRESCYGFPIAIFIAYPEYNDTIKTAHAIGS
jgi:hypothetical protein